MPIFKIPGLELAINQEGYDAIQNWHNQEILRVLEQVKSIETIEVIDGAEFFTTIGEQHKEIIDAIASKYKEEK